MYKHVLLFVFTVAISFFRVSPLEANVAVIAAPASAAASAAHGQSVATLKDIRADIQTEPSHKVVRTPFSVLMPPGSYLMVGDLDKFLTQVKKQYPKESVRVIDPKTKNRYEIRKLN